MNSNAVLTLAPKLAAAVKTLDALMSDWRANEFLIAQARKTCRVLADDLQSAVKEPQSIKPWGWRNVGDATPVSSVGTTEGREP